MNPIFDKLKGLIAGGTGKLVEALGNTADKFIQSKDEKDKFIKEMQEIANAQDLATHKLAIEEIKLDIEAEKNRLADVADSRNMNTKIQESDKASWLSKNVAYMLDLFLAILWGTVTIIIILKAFKVVGTGVDLTVLLSIHGTVSAIFMVTLQFHRGSSIGSERKQKELDRKNK